MTRPYHDIVCPKIKHNHEPIIERVLKAQPQLPPEATCVSARSPTNHKRAAETIARYFQREFQYDFVQYRADEYTSDDQTLAFLWTTDMEFPSDIAIGACCFRFRTTQWALQWIWLHPYCRRQGYLSRAWPAFTSMFGDFDAEPPLSEAMCRFMAKRGVESWASLKSGVDAG